MLGQVYLIHPIELNNDEGNIGEGIVANCYFKYYFRGSS